MSSQNFGGESLIPAATARGRDWPTLRQFCVFMENRVGRLHDLLRHIERHDLRIVALSVANSVDCAFARVMFHDADRAREILQLSNFAFSESDLVGVELPDSPQPYLEICMALMRGEVNIHYTYPLLYRRSDHGAIAIHVDNVDLALSTLAANGHAIITERDLLHFDEP